MHAKITTSKAKGFSLIEFMVAIAVAAVILSVVVVGMGRQRTAVELGNTAHNLALYYREAQSHATGVRNAGDETYDVGYGVHIDTQDPTHAIYFADRNNNARYDRTPTEEATETINLPGGIVVNRFCGTAGGEFRCSGPSQTSLDVTYRRPSLAPRIKGFPSGTDFAEVTVYVQGGGGEHSYSVNAAGQIAVDGE